MLLLLLLLLVVVVVVVVVKVSFLVSLPVLSVLTLKRSDFHGPILRTLRGSNQFHEVRCRGRRQDPNTPGCNENPTERFDT